MVLSFLHRLKFKNNQEEIIRNCTSNDEEITISSLEYISNYNKKKNKHLFAIVPNTGYFLMKKDLYDKVFYDQTDKYFVKEYKYNNMMINLLFIKFMLMVIVPFQVIGSVLTAKFVINLFNLDSMLMKSIAMVGIFSVLAIVSLIFVKTYLFYRLNRLTYGVARKRYHSRKIEALELERVLISRMIDYIKEDNVLDEDVRKKYLNKYEQTISHLDKIVAFKKERKQSSL